MYQIGILCWVSDEKDGGGEKDPIPDSLLSLQFDGKATSVTDSVGRTRLARNGGKADGGWNFFAYGLKKGLGSVPLRNVCGNLEIPMGTGTFGMDLCSLVLVSSWLFWE